MRRQFGSCVLFLLLGATNAWATQANEGRSPSGNIHFVVRGSEDDGHIFLFPRDHPEKEVDL
jgi:hypothetical protein